jgi:hypothetical protein
MEKKKPLIFYVFAQPGKTWLFVLYEQHRSFGHFLFSATERRWAYKTNPFPTGYKIKGNTALNRVIDQYDIEQTATSGRNDYIGKEEKVIWADPRNKHMVEAMDAQKSK